MRLFHRVYEWFTDQWYGRCEKVVQECAVCAAWALRDDSDDASHVAWQDQHADLEREVVDSDPYRWNGLTYEEEVQV